MGKFMVEQIPFNTSGERQLLYAFQYSAEYATLALYSKYDFFQYQETETFKGYFYTKLYRFKINLYNEEIEDIKQVFRSECDYKGAVVEITKNQKFFFLVKDDMSFIICFNIEKKSALELQLKENYKFLSIQFLENEQKVAFLLNNVNDNCQSVEIRNTNNIMQLQKIVYLASNQGFKFLQLQCFDEISNRGQILYGSNLKENNFIQIQNFERNKRYYNVFINYHQPLNMYHCKSIEINNIYQIQFFMDTNSCLTIITLNQKKIIRKLKFINVSLFEIIDNQNIFIFHPKQEEIPSKNIKIDTFNHNCPISKNQKKQLSTTKSLSLVDNEISILWLVEYLEDYDEDYDEDID